MYLLVQGLVSSLAGVVYFAFAARLLPTVADFGRLATLSMVGLFFVAAASFALPSAVVRFVSEFMGRGDSAGAGGVFGLAVRVGLVLAFVASLTCFSVSGPVASSLLGGGGYVVLVNLLSVDVFLLVLLTFLSGSLRGLQRFREIAVAGVVNALLRVGVAILLLYLGHGLVVDLGHKFLL